jgi:hypothetical protein
MYQGEVMLNLRGALAPDKKKIFNTPSSPFQIISNSKNLGKLKHFKFDQIYMIT